MQTASHEAVITLINALFKTRHPLTSSVDFPNTVTVSEEMKQIVSDIEVQIDGKYFYHIEAEIDYNLNIALRMFQYGYERGLKQKTTGKDGVITIHFPKALVLYWETTKSTPDTELVRFIFPDGTPHEFKIETFKVLEHKIGELARKKLLLLLPFSILKLRKQVVAAKTSEERKALAPELKKTMKDIFATLEESEKSGLLTKEDYKVILDQVMVLFSQIYEPFTEFKEITKMRDTILMGPIEKAEVRKSLEIARNLLERGINPEFVSADTGLPLRKVKALLKTTKVQQIA
jgi:hypothetical protein